MAAKKHMNTHDMNSRIIGCLVEMFILSLLNLRFYPGTAKNLTIIIFSGVTKNRAIALKAIFVRNILLRKLVTEGLHEFNLVINCIVLVVNSKIGFEGAVTAPSVGVVMRTMSRGDIVTSNL